MPMRENCQQQKWTYIFRIDTFDNQVVKGKPKDFLSRSNAHVFAKGTETSVQGRIQQHMCTKANTGNITTRVKQKPPHCYQWDSLHAPLFLPPCPYRPHFVAKLSAINKQLSKFLTIEGFHGGEKRSQQEETFISTSSVFTISYLQ